MTQQFEMVAKTLQGLEPILADELRNIGAQNITQGRRMVSFQGTLETLYRANICTRTALSILKPIYKFIAKDTDQLYEMAKEYDWSSILTLDKTFSIDTVSHSNQFTHTRYVTYRIKDAIVDHFKDRLGPDSRPRVRLTDADVMINVHIDTDRVTISLNSSGESLHHRGWRTATTEAPINEVLAAGILLKTGYDGTTPLVDPMCGSGTFLIEAALIAANIWPGTYRRHFAFESWKDFDPELLYSIVNDTTAQRTPKHKIYGSDISPKAIDISERNILSAGVDEYINLRIRPLQKIDQAPADNTPGILVTNPPYGQRLNPTDIENLYATLGTKLKHIYTGYQAWIISSNDDALAKIGLTPSHKEEIQNGGLDCQLRQYIIFQGDKKAFRRTGGQLKTQPTPTTDHPTHRPTDTQWQTAARRQGLGGQKAPNRPTPLADKYRSTDRSSRRDRNDRDPRPQLPPPTEAEQILNRRRNPNALRSLDHPQTPTIPRPEGPFMRTRRRGWKRPDTDTDPDTDPQQN